MNQINQDKLDISPIKRFIDGIIEREHIDRSRLLCRGAVWYQNGNDGTGFDYECNCHTCEFFAWWKSNEYGAIKVFVTEDKMEAYIYDEENPFSAPVKTVTEDSPFDLHELCEYLQGTRDDHDIWDKPVLEWELAERSYLTDKDEEDEE